MQTNHFALKIGLLIVIASWFVFSFTQLLSGIQNVLGFTTRTPWYIVLTEILGFIGLAFRSAGSLLALIATPSYFFFKKIGNTKTIWIIKTVLILEALYYSVTFIPSALWGVGPSPFADNRGQLAGNLTANFIPCLTEGVLIPAALLILSFKISSSKPKANAFKWGIIALTTYVIAFWVTNACNWIYAIAFQKGTAYLTNEPLNMLSFGATTIGLLALAIYSAYVAKTTKTENWQELPFSKIGAVVTLLGLYFLGVYLMWILLGSVGGWSAWYAWFLGHNVDLWAMTLPAVGIPALFFATKKNNTQNN